MLTIDEKLGQVMVAEYAEAAVVVLGSASVNVAIVPENG